MRFSSNTVVATLALSSVTLAQVTTLPANLPSIPALPSLPLPIAGLQKLVEDLNTLIEDIVAHDIFSIPGDIFLVALDVLVLGQGAGKIGIAASLTPNQATLLTSQITGTVCPQLAAIKSTIPGLSSANMANAATVVAGAAQTFLGVLGKLPLSVDTSSATNCLNIVLARSSKMVRSGGATIPVEVAEF